VTIYGSLFDAFGSARWVVVEERRNAEGRLLRQRVLEPSFDTKEEADAYAAALRSGRPHPLV